MNPQDQQNETPMPESTVAPELESIATELEQFEKVEESAPVVSPIDETMPPVSEDTLTQEAVVSPVDIEAAREPAPTYQPNPETRAPEATPVPAAAPIRHPAHTVSLNLFLLIAVAVVLFVLGVVVGTLV